MASPIRDQVTFHHTPATIDNRGEARPVDGRLKRAFYDEETDKTYTLTVTKGSSKRYLALPDSAWRDLLPDLRAMHPGECSKSIIDLSTKWIVALDDERDQSLTTHQIDREAEPERYNALASICNYLVYNKYTDVPSTSIAEGYDPRVGARTTFAAREARKIDDEELHRRIDRITERKEGFQDWTAAAAGDNPATRMGALPAALQAERARLETQKSDIERQLQGAARGNLRQIEALNHDLMATKEGLSALEHTTEIAWASALLGRSYDHKGENDWKVPLCMAFDAKRILLEHFTENVQQPITREDMEKLERRSTDIAALLIPPTLGDEGELQSGEAILHLFYAGGDTLSNLVRPALAAEANTPLFTPVTLPGESGHKYLREMLAQFHADQAQPLELPADEA